MAQPPPDPDDPAAWLEAHGDALYRYALPRVGRVDAAEDLVQETLLAALRARDSFAGRSSRRTWLIAILRRKIIDRVRRNARSRAVDEAALGEGALDQLFDERGFWRHRLGAWPAHPAAALEAREFHAAFERCLEKLPETLEQTFRLREVERMPPQQVREVLGISASNLWTRLHRARALLRTCLERNWFNPGAE